MDEKDDSAPVNDHYIQYYSQHIQDTTDHLKGNHPSSHKKPLSSSFHPPCAYWTPSEKNIFFHGLSIHSRLRPDLISADIGGTKTVLDVCEYIAVLEKGAAGARPIRRGAVEGASEMSDAWVEFEEGRAAGLVKREASWEAANLEVERVNILKAARSANDVPKGERRRQLGVRRERDRATEHTRLQTFKQFKVAKETDWARLDFLTDLDTRHLRVLDNILREAEEEPAAVELGVAVVERREGGAIPASDPVANIEGRSSNLLPPPTPDKLIDPILRALSEPGAGQLPPHVAQVSRPEARTCAIPATNMFFTPNGVSQAPNLDTTQIPPTTQTPDQNAQPANGWEDDDIDIDVSQLSPRSRRRHQKRLYMRRKRAQSTGAVVCQRAVRLKPGRKTSKKRDRDLRNDASLLPSRSSAEVRATGGIGEGLGMVPMGCSLEKAKFTINPDEGKDTVEIGGKEEGGGDESIQLDDDDDDDDDDRGESSTTIVGHPHIGGTTLPYKIKAQFEELGMDASVLRSNGLGMFHLSRLAKLMKLYNSMSSASEDVNTRISGRTIQFLHANLIRFVTDLIRRTVVLHEVDAELKRHTKVWRRGDEQINASSVRRAVEMGADEDKTAHFDFDGLVGRMDGVFGCRGQGQGQDNDDHDEEEERESNDDSSDSESSSLSFSETADDDSAEQNETSPHDSKTTIHRDIYPPFIWHPSISMDVTNPTIPFKSSSSSSSQAQDLDLDLDVDIDDKGTLMPDKIDTAALISELIEEDELDARDCELAVGDEMELWREFGCELPDELLSDTSQTSRTAGAESEGEVNESIQHIRFGQPKAGTGVKSNVYVVDSD